MILDVGLLSMFAFFILNFWDLIVNGVFERERERDYLREKGIVKGVFVR